MFVSTINFSVYPETLHSLLSSMNERTSTVLIAARFTASQPESMRRQLLLKSWKALRSAAIPRRCPEGLLCCTCLQYNRTYTPSTRLIQRCVFCCSICLNSQTSSCIHRWSTLSQCKVCRSWLYRLFPTWQNMSISLCSIESSGCLCIHPFQLIYLWYMIGTAGLEEPQLIELTTPAVETQVLENPSLSISCCLFSVKCKIRFCFYNQRTCVIISHLIKGQETGNTLWTEKSHAFVKLRKYVTHCGGECNVGHVLRSRTFSCWWKKPDCTYNQFSL